MSTILSRAAFNFTEFARLESANKNALLAFDHLVQRIMDDFQSNPVARKYISIRMSPDILVTQQIYYLISVTHRILLNRFEEMPKLAQGGLQNGTALIQVTLLLRTYAFRGVLRYVINYLAFAFLMIWPDKYSCYSCSIVQMHEDSTLCRVCHQLRYFHSTNMHPPSHFHHISIDNHRP